jgi:hypothetical protein
MRLIILGIKKAALNAFLPRISLSNKTAKARAITLIKITTKTA